MTRSLLVLADRLGELGGTRVVVEATSDDWKPVFYLLEAAGFEAWLVNARDVEHLPGRPKTDRLDAVWLCKVAERQLLRPSFVPPPPIRRLRDLARYRADLVAVRTAEKQRVEQAAGWTPRSSCRWSPRTSSGSRAGRYWRRWSRASATPEVLAQLARGRLRAKRSVPVEAFTSHFTDHYGFLLARMLAWVDALDSDVAELDRKLEELIAPFAAAVDRLDEITGVGRVAAQ
jgi:transposase